MEAWEQEVVSHTITAIGRTGARSVEVGSLDDEPPYRWHATAQYHGAKVSCDNQPDPMAAVLGLYAILAAGAECVICSRVIALQHGTEGLLDGARMREGVFETCTADRPAEAYCVRRLRADGWHRCGC